MKKIIFVILKLCGEKRYGGWAPEDCPDLKIDQLLLGLEKLYDRDMGNFEKITPPVSVANQRSSATTIRVSTRALVEFGRTFPAMEFARALEQNQNLLRNSFGPMLEIIEKRNRQLRNFAEISAGFQKMAMLSHEAVTKTLAQSEPILKAISDSQAQMASWAEIGRKWKTQLEPTRKLVEALVRRNCSTFGDLSALPRFGRPL